MKVRLLLAFFIMVFVASSCSVDPIDEAELPSAINAVEVEHELLGIVNAYRNTLGQGDLSFSAVAYEHANDHNDYMVSTGTLSHHNFTLRASQISSETNAEFVAENVAKGYSTAAAAFQNWLDSPNHKSTLEDDFTHTAISVKVDDNGTYFYTQLFYR
ncbi:MAG: CAP domain-containing protein [Eudoraea sp.]|nr:CAP domain-containing protein [Eudoraea sp.]